MAFRRLLVLCIGWIAGSALAAVPPVVVEAKEGFQLHTVDGGLSPYTTLVALPGQDRALVGGGDVGLPLASGEYALVQLGGANAGSVVGAVPIRTGAASFFPESILRASGSGAASTYWTLDASGLVEALGRLDSTGLDVLPVSNRSFATGTALGVDGQGELRAIAVDPQGNVLRLAFVARDGGVEAQGGDGVPLQPGAPVPAMAFSPPGTNDVFAFSGSAPLLAMYGRFTQPDAGLTTLGPVPSSPVAFTSQAYTILIGFTSSPGVFEVSQLSSSAALSKGTFAIALDGGCDSPSCTSQTVALQALREGFPGYPAGALLVAGYGTEGGLKEVVLVPWETVANAFGLPTDATRGPDATLSSSGTGPGGGTSPINGEPRGPGVTGTAASGCSAVGSSALPLGALGVLLLAAFRTRRS